MGDMDKLREQVKTLVDKEYERSSEKFGETYHSSHEALGVLWEEVKETTREMSNLQREYNFFGYSVMDDNYTEQIQRLEHINKVAVNGACEFIQVANVAQKAIKSMKDKPTITARERHFLEFIKTGWIAQDENGDVWWFEEQPRKVTAMWDTSGSSCHITGLVKEMLPFVAWEDKEPWSVEELLKLEVVE